MKERIFSLMKEKKMQMCYKNIYEKVEDVSEMQHRCVRRLNKNLRKRHVVFL